MRFRIAALMFLCLSAASVAAEPDSLSLKKGDRVRIKAGVTEGVFVVEEVNPASLWLREPDDTAAQMVLIGDISSLAIRVERSRGWGAARGAIIWGGAGFIIGVVTGVVSGDDEPGMFSLTASEKAIFVGGGLFGYGVILGGIAGMIHPGKRWESIPLNARLDAGAARNGTVRIGIAFSFGGP